MVFAKYLLQHSAPNTQGLLYYYWFFFSDYFLHSVKGHMVAIVFLAGLGVQMLWNQEAMDGMLALLDPGCVTQSKYLALSDLLLPPQ